MKPVVDKAFAYITNRNRLLVFTHLDAPEAGVQTPAGTIEPDESPEAAALREAREETGLEQLAVAGFLGKTERDMKDFGKAEIHRRWFFHLTCPGEPPEFWRHDEIHSFGSEPAPVRFAFFWVSLNKDLRDLIADHGLFLPELRANLAKRRHDND